MLWNSDDAIYIGKVLHTHTHRRGTRDRCFDYSTGPDWLREGATACPNDGRTYRLCVKHTHIRSGCQQGVKAHVPSAHLSGRTTHTIRISNVNRVEFMLNCTLHALLFYRSCIFPCYVIINFMNIFSAVRSASWKFFNDVNKKITTKWQRKWIALLLCAVWNSPIKKCNEFKFYAIVFSAQFARHHTVSLVAIDDSRYDFHIFVAFVPFVFVGD